MTVADIMMTDIVTAPPTATYHEVALILRSHRLTGIPIIDVNSVLVGIISEKDLFSVLYPKYDSYYDSPSQYTDFEDREKKVLAIKDDPITKFMKADIITAHPDTPILRVGGLMLAKGIHTIPVVDKESDRLLGICNRMDIYHTIIEKQLNLV